MPRRPLSYLRNAALGLAAALALLAAAEFGLRVLRGAPPAAPLPQGFAYNYADTLKPFFKPAGRAPGGAEIYKTNLSGATPQSFLMPKPKGTYRIFIVGGSVAVRFNNAPRFAETLKKLPFKKRRAKLITCGMPGYDSGQTLGVLRQVFRYQPDLVIDMDGNNEYGRTEMTPLQIRLYLADRAMSRLWLYRGLKALLGVRPGLRGRKVGVASLEPNFEANLRRIVNLCRAHGVRLVLCTLPANVRGVPPLTGHPPWGDTGYFAAARAFENRRYRQAAALFQRYLRAHPRGAYAHFFLAKSLERLGEKSQAAREYRLADDWDLKSERTPPRRNADIRRIARQESAPLADLEKLFDGWARLPGAPGGGLFRDNCHWWLDEDPTVLQAMLWAAFPGDAALRPPARRPDWWRPERVTAQEQLLAAAGNAAPHPDQGPPDEAVVAMMRPAYAAGPRIFLRTLFDPAPVLARPLWPWAPGFGQVLLKAWPRVLLDAGEMLRREGQNTLALECARRSLASDPGNPAARLLEAQALEGLGQKVRARAAFERLLKDYPGRRDFRNWAAAAGVTPGA